MLGLHPFHAVGEKYISPLLGISGCLPLLIPSLGEELGLEALIAELDGLFFTGSPSNVEPHRYGGESSRPGTLHDPERDATTLGLIPRAIAAGVPVLGICLGAQLIASAHGARVYRNTEKEIGWFDIHACAGTEDAFDFPPTTTVLHWHGETFDLPPGARLLASSAACRHQAFQLGERAIGLQFHLEMTADSLRAIIDNCRVELVPARWIQDEEKILAEASRHFAATHALMDRLLDWLTRPAAGGR